jgi:hypothetical protein
MTTLILPLRTKGGRRKTIADQELAQIMRPYFRRAVQVTGLPIKTFTSHIEQSLAMAWPRKARSALIYVLACQGLTDVAIGRATSLCASHIGQILIEAASQYQWDQSFEALCRQIATT